MDFYEYQAKEVFTEYGIPAPRGRVIYTPEAAAAYASELAVPVAVKAQIPVGGRGKAGGIRFASNPQAAYEIAQKLLKSNIKGFTVDKLLVEEKIKIEKELYLGITIDRNLGKPVVMASGFGGVDIESVKKDCIFSETVDPLLGFYPHRAREIIGNLGLKREEFKSVSNILYLLYNIFEERDCILLEINPLGITNEGAYAVDARMVVDDNALFRQGIKIESSLSYVELDGDIGCIVNGAGLAMSTMDTIKNLGGKPANFLDIGGGASKEKMKEAIEKIISHPQLKAVFINILGGITKCDEIARGIIDSKDLLDIPLVIRLRGTNEKEATRLLESKGFEILVSMDKAAKKVVELAR